MPSMIKDNSASYDSSTPSQYNAHNSGLIGYVTNGKGETVGAIITSNAKDRYNNLILSYVWQVYDAEKVKIKQGDGVEPYKDIYNNDLHIIDSEHLAYFMKMNRWKKEGRPDDGIWMRVKGGVLK